MSDKKKSEQEDAVEGKTSNFVTPRVDQGSEPIGADEGERNVPLQEEEDADQSSLGGTGGDTGTTV